MAVRAILLMVLGLAAFVAAMLLPQRQAVGLRELEAPIPHELSVRALRGVEPDAESQGYRFHWLEPGEHEAVLVAGPLRYGKTGVRWFATRNGKEIFEYDPTLFVVGSKGPNTRELQKYCSLPDRQRTRSNRPFGWKPLR